MKKLSTLVKLATLFVIGGGTIGAAVGISEASTNPTHLEDGFVAEAEPNLPSNINEAFSQSEWYFNGYIDYKEALGWNTNKGDVTWLAYWKKESMQWTKVYLNTDSKLMGFYIPELKDVTKLVLVEKINGGDTGPNWNSIRRQSNDLNYSFDKSKKILLKVHAPADYFKNYFDVIDTDYKAPKSSGVISGNNFYVDTLTNNNNFNFTDADAKVYAYFFNSFSQNAFSSRLINSLGNLKGCSNLLTCTVPMLDNNITIWESVIIVRFDKSATEDDVNSWNKDKLFNKTFDLKLSRPDARYIDITWLHDNVQLYEANVNDIDYLNNAVDWAKKFSTYTDDNCNHSGSSHDKILQSWGEQSTSFNSLTSITQNIIKTCSADQNGGAIQKALSSYDYIVDKYTNYVHLEGITDFMDRKPRSLFGNQTQSLNANELFENSGTIVITSVAVLSTTAIAMFAFISKKKRLFK